MVSKRRNAAVSESNNTSTRRPDRRNLRFLALIAIPIVIGCLIAAKSRREQSLLLRSTGAIASIPISLVLKENLRLAEHSWEHGVLTHALLELQNPELTVFAGPGYGFDLRGSKSLDAFPDGNLPKCASTEKGSSWGRYDKWTNVKGLRYAAGKVDLGHDWLYRGGSSAADAASLGWATLLLERAGATDPMLPVPAGRNVFGEAADRMVNWLVEKNLRSLVSNTADDEEGGLGEVPLRNIGGTTGTRWAFSHQTQSKQLWADSVFMVPPFLAAYAVARRNATWAHEAVEQIKAYRDVLAMTLPKEIDGQVGVAEFRPALWKHIVSQPRSLKADSCCRDKGFWLTGNAWALAGIIRVYGVLARCQFLRNNAILAERQFSDTTLLELKSMAWALLSALFQQKRTEGGVLPDYLDPVDNEHRDWQFGDAAGSALVASSIYRSAQLGIIDFGDLDASKMITWADSLYSSVAANINKRGILGNVTSVSEVPARHAVSATSEGQSFVLMMYAARRDCAKLGVCR